MLTVADIVAWREVEQAESGITLGDAR